MTLCSKALAVGLCALVIGCDVHDTTPPKASKSAQTCEPLTGSASQATEAVRRDLESNQYRCFEQHIDVARASPPNEELAALARQALARKDLPESVAVFALSYLVLADRTDPRTQTEPYIDAIRRVAKNGSGKVKTTALALLSARRDDADLAVFQEGVKSGDEAVLAYSIFGMANSCSEKARAALHDALSSAEVKAYLSKYADKESITATVRRDCPAAMA